VVPLSYYCPKCLKRNVVVVKREYRKGAWHYYYRCRSCGYEYTKKRFHMRLITVHLPQFYIDGLKQLVEMGRYPNKSEAIRVAVRDLLARELWNRREGMLISA